MERAKHEGFENVFDAKITEKLELNLVFYRGQSYSKNNMMMRNLFLE